jgi:hypothetical protein
MKDIELKTRFLAGVIIMSERAKSEKIQAQFLRDAFEGMKGGQPKSDQELKEWLATDEGKMATMFQSTGLSAHGDESSGGIPLIQILRDRRHEGSSTEFGSRAKGVARHGRGQRGGVQFDFAIR